jgi:hypothetical protein
LVKANVLDAVRAVVGGSRLVPAVSTGRGDYSWDVVLCDVALSEVVMAMRDVSAMFWV